MIIQKILKNALRENINSLRPAKVDKRDKAAIVFELGEREPSGDSIVERFRREGLQTYHKTLPATDISVDAISGIYDQIQKDNFSIDAVIVVGSVGQEQSFLDIDVDELFSEWQQTCLSCFYIGQAAVTRMQPNKRGTVIFTSVADVLDPGIGRASIGSQGAGVRMLSQSLAREFGPHGIHVSHVVMGNDDASSNNQGGIYWNLYQQNRTAWTQELIMNNQRRLAEAHG
ncbi:hypothetical protein A9Q99_15690 [Gammaproteobacteria bacterium 45_16_T64]|nr:hypothetical protein A9Q99_15690 [Gammaproteobacteria bacterium 45_16_T64]